MKPRATSASARLLPTALSLAVMLLAATALRAQVPTTEERLKILTDPESLKAKLEEKKKEKTKPPIELFRSQIAPFDILPFVKANHWSTLSVEMRANYEDYAGILRTAPIRLLGMPRDGQAMLAPQEIHYSREARLIKEQRARIGLQLLMPLIPRELSLELIRPDAIRPDDLWPANLRVLEPHQMLILVLTKGPNDEYARWNHLHSFIPEAADRGDASAIEKQRYYRMVLPLDPDKPLVSSHPLTWTTVSHVVWDGMAPETLNPSQQAAMLDWLHWGGQLVLVGGAKPTFASLRDSFLDPYLPADPSPDNALLSRTDLAPMSQEYRPPVPPFDRDDPQPIPDGTVQESLGIGRFYLPAAPIVPASNRPVFLAGLQPRPGASTIPLGASGGRLLGVEQRVGRGRILMLALSPNDPALAAWPGLDTFLRRVVLRRPEDPLFSMGGWDGTQMRPPGFAALPGTELSWVRYMSRDLGASMPRVNSDFLRPNANAGESEGTPPGERDNLPIISSASAVAEWVDSSALPRLSRDALEEASGISIPSASFVLKVILAYVIALVPLNLLICRYALGRREWAWVVVPALALGFAVMVERMASYDLGYDVACDEVDVLEVQGDYPRGHLSRFSSLYTTGRFEFNIAFPDAPTALALPMDNGRSLRGEDVATSTWQSQPVPALLGLKVQPRSLSLFRAEEMINLSGAIHLAADETGRRVVNASDIELRDAVLIDVNAPKDRRETFLGTIAPGATAKVEPGKAAPKGKPADAEVDPSTFLREFRAYAEGRAEDQGEIRLVAWSPKVFRGMKIEPAPDRHRGVTAVVVHLRNGPPPAPDGPRYDRLARDPKDYLERRPPAVDPNSNPEGSPRRRRPGPFGGRRPPPIAPMTPLAPGMAPMPTTPPSMGSSPGSISPSPGAVPPPMPPPPAPSNPSPGP